MAQITLVVIIGVSVLTIRCVYLFTNHTAANALLALTVIVIYTFTCGSLFIASLRLLSRTPGLDIVASTNNVESSGSRLYSEDMSKDGYD